MTFILLALLSLSLPSYSFADATEDFGRLTKQMMSINQASPCEDWKKMSLAEKCKSKMDKLYEDHKAVVDVFIGYNDNDNDTNNDSVMRAYLVDRLYRACSPTVSEPCDFKGDPKNANHLIKTTSSGDEVIVNLSDSAYSNRDSTNRVNPNQVAKSTATRNRFLNSIKNGEAVFFIGHSRDGGGPDFAPPKLTSSGHVDYDWYRNQKPGLKDVLDNMSESHPEIFGSFSCDSIKHFAKPIREKNPNVLYFGTTRLASESTAYKVERDHPVPDRVTSSEVIDSALIAIGGVCKKNCSFNNDFRKSREPTLAVYE